MTGTVVVIAPSAPPPTMMYLADIVIPSLPSPYYHFDYDTAGRVVKASFASGLTMYDVVYAADGRIRELRNNTLANHDRVQYAYDNADRVTGVRYVDDHGATLAAATLAYEQERLVKLERPRFSADGLIVDKTMSFSYYPDGNLSELTEHRPPIERSTLESQIRALRIDKSRCARWGQPFDCRVDW